MTLLQKPAKALLKVALALVSTAALAQEAPLTSGQVKTYLKARIELANIQNDMKANASQYEDLPRAYYEKETAYVKSLGFTHDQFKTMEGRIFNALDYIENGAEREKSEAELRKQAERYLSDDPLSFPENQQLIAQLRAAGVPEAEVQKVIKNMTGNDKRRAEVQKALAQDDTSTAQSKADIPGVKPWVGKLNHFSGWYAGNDEYPNPPVVD